MRRGQGSTSALRRPRLPAASPPGLRRPSPGARRAGRRRRRTSGPGWWWAGSADCAPALRNCAGGRLLRQSAVAISFAAAPACKAAAAMRQGSRAALSPPGSARARRWPRRRTRAPCIAQQLAAPGCAVGAQADAVQRQAEQGPVRRARPPPRRCGRGGAARRWPAGPAAAPVPAAKRVLKKSGCRSCATNCGALQHVTAGCCHLSAHAQVAALSRPPMCCERKASSPRVTQTVFFR
jgi:hypothetical protein